MTSLSEVLVRFNAHHDRAVSEARDALDVLASYDGKVPDKHGLRMDYSAALSMLDERARAIRNAVQDEQITRDNYLRAEASKDPFRGFPR